MLVLCGKGEHGFIGFFDPSAHLPYKLPFGGYDGSCPDHARMLALAVGNAGILPCCDTSRFMRHLRIGIHVDEVESGFGTPAAAL